MRYYTLCLLVFISTYCLNMTFISIFYHRGIAHESVFLSARLRRFVIVAGSWITGIDLKSWVCMHRMHHAYSDTLKDPHSPKRWGIFGTLIGQLISYNKTLRELDLKNPDYTAMVHDLDFDVNILNRKNISMLPYAIQLAIAITCGWVFNCWLLGSAYFFGMMSHPIQGWLVNSFGHAVGYTNFDVSDDSRNNTLVAWLCFGEGYQNNHHRFPKSAKFSVRWFEFDMGYMVANILARFGMLKISKVNFTTSTTDGFGYWAESMLFEVGANVAPDLSPRNVSKMKFRSKIANDRTAPSKI